MLSGIGDTKVLHAIAGRPWVVDDMEVTCLFCGKFCGDMYPAVALFPTAGFPYVLCLNCRDRFDKNEIKEVRLYV